MSVNQGARAAGVEANCGAHKEVNPVSLEGLQWELSHMVLQFSAKVKTWEMSGFAGITERRSAVFDISRTKWFHILLQRNWLGRRNCSDSESVSLWQRTVWRFWAGSGFTLFYLEPLTPDLRDSEITAMRYANLFTPLPLLFYAVT
jgi:hypothetical protein